MPERRAAFLLAEAERLDSRQHQTPERQAERLLLELQRPDIAAVVEKVQASLATRAQPAKIEG